jgi:cytoskeletal protein CcmA (bactofilin family)
MGATYTRQSSATIVDGTTIEAAHFNNEFDQLVAAFAVSTGHTHDGTTAEGGAITKLLGTAITIGDATAGTDITVTFDGESNDGVLAWMEDEDYFKFSDDILLNSTERLNFGDTGTYIFQSTDGQLDIVADTELQIAATTVDINGNVDISGTLTVAGAVDLGDAALSNVGAVQLDSIAGDGDTNTSITFSGSDVITIATGGSGRLTIGDGALSPVTNNQIDLGTASLEFKDGYFDGTVTADAFAGPLTGNVTGNVSGTAATVTTAAQSNITSLGTLTTLTVDNIITNGTTIGHTDDTDLLTLASGVLTVAGELDAVSLDISGDADIDGTLEADAITIGGITLAETIADTVGAMVTSNTESGITVTYDDADNTLDFTVGTLNQNTTGSAATLTTARTIGGTSFDGSANIAVGLAATATALATARTIGGTSFDGTANIAVGLAATATALATARTIHGVSFDGTANIDLSEVISDTVGAMVASNTETGIAVTYDDADNTLDFVIGAGTIVNSMLADDAVGADELAADAVVNASVAAGAAIVDTKLATIATANKVSLTAVDIDGGTDIGADLTTSDLIVVDDGAGGTNRKAALSRVVTLMAANLEDPTALAIALG